MSPRPWRRAAARGGSGLPIKRQPPWPLGVSSGGLQLGHQRLGRGGTLHRGESIALRSGDGGLIGSVIAEGLSELLAQVRFTGLEAGNHADDAIEQGSHGLDG